MPALRRAFFPNLDADNELASRGPYQPRKEVLMGIRRQTPLLSSLVQDDALLDRAEVPRFDARSTDIVVCWCPTQSAVNTLRKMGWPVAKGPAHEILRRVNVRRFVQEHGRAPFERHWLERGSDLSVLGSGRFRLKRAHGFAGRGQRVVDRALSRDDWRWIEDSLDGGFTCEPECQLLAELSVHGYVDAHGLLLGTPCRLTCDRFGSVVSFERAEDGLGYARELRAAAERIAGAMVDEGYFGPFGIDAFVALTASGTVFNPLSDLNARFTLVWSLGMGTQRELALGRLCSAVFT